MKDAYVTAKYDYKGEIGSLSFSSGDTIKVVSRLPNGWWDGVCNGDRGWFPSNYVTSPSEEMESILSPLTINSPNFPRPTSPISLPENWGIKSLQDGKEYYFNLLTNETKWSFHATEQAAGVEMPDGPEEDKGLIFTWSGIKEHLEFKLRTLVKESKEKNKHTYLNLTLNIVQGAHMMFLASSTEDRDCQILEKNPALKKNHMKILSWLAKLILDAKVGSTVWPPPDAEKNLQTTSIELINAISAFTTEAERVNLDMIALSEEEMADEASAKYSKGTAIQKQTDSELVADLEAKMVDISTLVSSIQINHIPIDDDIPKTLATTDMDRKCLIESVHKLVVIVGSFLSLTDELPVESLVEELTMDFKVCRLTLLNSVTELVMSARKIPKTRNLPDLEILEKSLLSIESVVRSTKDLLFATKFLIEEKENAEYAALKTKIDVCCGPAVEDENQSGNTDTLTNSPVKSKNSALKQLEVSAKTSIFMGDSENGLLSPSEKRTSQPLSPRVASLRSSSDRYSNSNPRSPSIANSLHSVAESEAPPFAAPSHQNSVPRVRSLLALAAETNSSALPVVQEKPQELSIDYSKLALEKDDFNPNEIVVERERIVSASLPAIICKLTSHLSRDENFNNTFLLTYRTITTTNELLGLLFDRFRMSAPEDLNEAEVPIWKEKKLKLVRIRVFAILKLWLESYIQDDEEDRKALTLLTNFAENEVKPNMSVSYSTLMKLVEKRKSGGMKPFKSSRLSVMKEVAPPSILPKNIKKFKLYELDPIEFARQITIHMAELYSSIESSEFLAKAWNLNLSVDNFNQMVLFTGKLTNWIVFCILQVPDTKKRARAIGFFISVANASAALNNYALSRAVLDALQAEPISRLEMTWEMLNLKYANVLEVLKNLLNPYNPEEYRNLLKQVKRPCIPLLGLIFADLLALKDAEPTILESGLLNTAKLYMISEVLSNANRNSNQYVLRAVPEIRKFVEVEIEAHQLSHEELMWISEKLERPKSEMLTHGEVLQNSGLF